MAIRIGVCGAGAFAQQFIPLFKAHPRVSEVLVADILPDRASATAEKFGIKRPLSSLDDLCRSDLDAIALFTQRQLHGPQAVQALRAGKHVYSAVPMGQTLEEVRAIVQAVEQTRLVYMTGETSYYYPAAVYCRDRFRKGDFGAFVYGEGQYLHDMSHFYQSFMRSGGADWKKVAGIPPMHYPTHSSSMVLSVTGARATQVSCMGYVDNHEDAIFRRGANHWDNIFSNESALMRTSDGGMLRINEFRRVGWKGMSSVQTSIFGTKGCYEEQANAQAWVTVDPKQTEDLTNLLRASESHGGKPAADVNPEVWKEFHMNTAKVHKTGRLPKELKGLPNGHAGSHQFLVDDFVKAVAANRLPPNNVWDSARYLVPGLVAHQSAVAGGRLMYIPDLGSPAKHWAMLDPDVE
ncbi:MAG: Gfo/Idh/MocA family oxidoreductase [SAR202 cluster bacterium]|nr:Gfo/Idh/MocA family oxidoreductase [SAR202 cluster bacterium]